MRGSLFDFTPLSALFVQFPTSIKWVVRERGLWEIQGLRSCETTTDPVYPPIVQLIFFFLSFFYCFFSCISREYQQHFGPFCRTPLRSPSTTPVPFSDISVYFSYLLSTQH